MRDYVIKLVDGILTLVFGLALIFSVILGLTVGGGAIIYIPLGVAIIGAFLTGGWYCLSGIYWQLKKLNGEKINETI